MPVTRPCPRSVEELARYFGCQLRALRGGMWKRVVFDVAVSSGPGQAGVVRFAGCALHRAPLHSIPFHANARLFAASEAHSLIAGMSNGTPQGQFNPINRTFSTSSRGRSLLLNEHRRRMSSASHQGYDVTNAVSAPPLQSLNITTACLPTRVHALKETATLVSCPTVCTR